MSSDVIFIKSFLIDDDGVTAVEYALIAFFIFFVIVVSVGDVGQKALDLYNNVASVIP